MDGSDTQSSLEVSRSSTQPLTSFPLFSKLPLELRFRIWELSLPGPRIVLLREEWRGGAKDVDFEPHLRALEERRQRKKYIRSETVEMLRRGEDLDFIPYEIELREMETAPDFRFLERRQRHYYAYNEDYGGSDDESSTGTEDDDLDGFDCFGTDIADDLWVQGAIEVNGGGIGASSTLNDPLNQSPPSTTHITYCSPGALSPAFHGKDTVASQPEWCLKSMGSPPTALYTCQESAFAARSYYNSFNCDESVLSRVFFNFQSDILYLDSRTFLEKLAIDESTSREYRSLYSFRNFDAISLAKITRLALDWDDWYEKKLSLSWVFRYFPALTELTMVVNDSDQTFNHSDLLFTPLKDIDGLLYEYEGSPVRLEGQDRKRNLDSNYPRLFQTYIFIKHIRKEMAKRLARIDQDWKVKHIQVVTLSDGQTEKKITEAQGLYWDTVDKLWQALYNKRPTEYLQPSSVELNRDGKEKSLEQRRDLEQMCDALQDMENDPEFPWP